MQVLMVGLEQLVRMETNKDKKMEKGGVGN